jgi:hypothetical protein
MSIQRDASFCSASGGVVRYSADGEILFEVAVPAGKVPVREYVDMLPEGGEMETSGLTVVNPRQLGGRLVTAGAYESGANPDFQPTTATRMEVEMREQIRQAQLLNRTVAAKLAALNAIQTMPQAPAAQPDPDVIE